MSVAPPQFKQYLSIEESVQYLQFLGFANADEKVLRYHVYETEKLPLPILIKRRSYWAKKDLDALIETLSNRSRDELKEREGRQAAAVKRRQAEAKHKRALRQYEAAKRQLESQS